MNFYIIGIFLIILGVILFVNGEATSPVQINSAIQSNSAIENDSTGRSILSAGSHRRKRYSKYLDTKYQQTQYVSEQPVYQSNQISYDISKESQPTDYHEDHQTDDQYSYYQDHDDEKKLNDRSDDTDNTFTHVVDGTSWIQMITMGAFAYGWLILSVQFLLGLTNPPNIQNYLTIFPFKKKKEAARSMEDSLITRVLKSVDPVDLTFGVLSIDGEQCRLRAVCQLRKTVAAMPMLQGYLDSYMPSISTMEKYSGALAAGEALEDCYRLFPDCENDPYQKLPKFLQY